MLQRVVRERWVWGLWVLLAVLVVARFLQAPHRKVDTYRTTSLAWVSGEPLYNQFGVGFVYAPHAAALYAPFAILPELPGQALWLVVNLGIFAWGTWRLARVTSDGPDSFGVLSLLAIPLSLGSALNGQFNLVMMGFMMLAAAQVAEGRWWSAVLALWLAVLFKPLALVLFLLLLPFHPPLLWRMLASVPLVLLFPYLAQTPGYVTDQYLAFVESLRISSDQGDVRPFAHIFSTLSLLGLEVTNGVRNGLRVAFAGLTLLLCWRAHLRLPRAEAAFFILGLAVTYLLVFNPRTEGVTYAILGPILGAWVIWVRQVGVRFAFWTTAALVPLICALVVGNYELGRLVAPGRPAVLFVPLAGCLCYTGLCVHLLLRTRPATTGASPVTSPTVSDRRAA